jgi:glycosyltransferase involved in cell wall biosynthesis
MKRKGLLATVPEIYNPDRTFRRVIHFTPYIEDEQLSDFFMPWNIEVVSHRAVTKNPFQLALEAIKVFAKIRQEKVDLVRGRLPYLGSLLGCLSARVLRIPSVVSLGGDNRIVQVAEGKYHYNSRFVSFTTEKLVLLLTTKIMVPNRFTSGYVAQIIGPERAKNKTVIIPWRCEAIEQTDPNEPNVNDRFHLSEKALIVTIIGFINRYKYSHVLFEALDSWLPSSVQPVVFVFCGDGPLRQDGEKRFSKRDDVLFIGWQDRAVVHALIRRASIVLIPMSGFVLLEAASMGKPVVTSRVEWHSELVEDMVSGRLVDPEDPMQWRSAIEQLLRAPETASKFGRALKRTFDADYSPDRSKLLEIELYRELIRNELKGE